MALPERVAQRLPSYLDESLLREAALPAAARPPANVDPVEVWVSAADAVLSLALVNGSLLTLLQLPRAIYCRGAVRLPPVTLAQLATR